MPNYQGTRATPRMDLGAAVMEILETAETWAGLRALPIFKTPVKEASYSAITRESIARESDMKRAPRGSYNRDNFDAEDKTFNCEEYGTEQPIDDGERILYAKDFDADMVAVRVATRRLMAAQEKRIADLVLNTTTFTGATLYTDNSGTPWDTVSTDIIAQVGAAKEKVRQNSGMKANALIMGWSNIERCIINTNIRASISPTHVTSYDEIISRLASLFGLRYIIVGDAVRNTANEGIAFSGSDVWNDDYVMVARVVENPEDLSEPGLGRTFLWTPDSPENVTVEEYREEPIRSDVFRVRQHTDEVLIDANFGHMLKVDA